MADVKKRAARPHLHGPQIREEPAKTRRQLMREIARLRTKLEEGTTASIGEVQALRSALKRKAALMSGPTRNFSKEAVKAAAKFRGLKTAQIDTHLEKARAEAIKRAVDKFYGLR
jgi:hypothetical protein